MNSADGDIRGPALIRPSPRFEDPAHLHQILSYADRGFLPLKYAYAGSAAFTHTQLARTSGYASVVGATALEVDTLLRSLPCEPPVQIAEVGPGTGDHTAAFLTRLCQVTADARGPAATPLSHTRYLGLDFSSTLLDSAVRRIVEVFHHMDTSASEKIDVDAGQWDLECGPTARIEGWRTGGGPVLICVLGHTLGNLEEPSDALRNLAISARPGDLLLLGVTLCPPEFDDLAAETVLSPYLNETFSAAVLEPWRAAALGEACVGFDVRLVGRSVIGEMTFLRPVTVAGHRYAAGKTVRCFTSARFLPHESLELVERAGWEIVDWAVDDTADHQVVVARRSEAWEG